VKKILDSHKRPPLPADAQKTIWAIVRKADENKAKGYGEWHFREDIIGWKIFPSSSEASGRAKAYIT